MKTYVLIVSGIFPKTHKRAGGETQFVSKIFNGSKKHTIRANYDLWAKRINEVKEGKALISLRFWSGKPYRSKQVEFSKITNDNSIDVQKLTDPDNFAWATIDGKMVNWDDVAKNDGLSFDDFCEWFKNPKNEPMALIQFTSFRY